MERYQSKPKEPDLKLISSKKEISGEYFKIYYPELSRSCDIYKMGPLWYKLNSLATCDSGLEMGDIEQINESLVSLVNKSDMVLVPTIDDGEKLADFYAEFAKRDEGAREKLSMKTYAVSGRINEEDLSIDLFSELRKKHRGEYLNEKRYGVNFFIISDVSKSSPIHEVVYEFSKYLTAWPKCPDSLSIYSNLSEEMIKISRFLESQSAPVRSGIRLNVGSERTHDFVDRAISVGDVYLGLSSYESYSSILYKSIFAGKGLILPNMKSAIEIAGKETDGCAKYINPHCSLTTIEAMKSLANNQNILSQMMVNNISRGSHFTSLEYDKRVKMAAMGGIAPVWEISKTRS